MNWYYLLKIAAPKARTLAPKVKKPVAPVAPPAPPVNPLDFSHPAPSYGKGLTPEQYEKLYFDHRSAIGQLDETKFRELNVPEYDEWSGNRRKRDLIKELPPLASKITYVGFEGWTPKQKHPFLNFSDGILRFIWHPITGKLYMGTNGLHPQLMPKNRGNNQIADYVRGFWFPDKQVVALRPYYNQESNMDGWTSAYRSMNNYMLAALRQRLYADLKPQVPNLKFDAQGGKEGGDASGFERQFGGDGGSGVSNDYLATKYRDLSSRW